MGLGIFNGLGHEHQWLVLLVLVFVKVPKLLLGFPPFNHATETGHCKEYLHIPVPPMPVRMVVPGSTNVLDALHDSFHDLGLRSELSDSHVRYIGSHADDLVEGSHDGIDGIIDENPRRAVVEAGAERIFGKTSMSRKRRQRRSRT